MAALPEVLVAEMLASLEEIVAKFDACDNSVVRHTPLGITRARRAIASVKAAAQMSWGTVPIMMEQIDKARAERRLTDDEAAEVILSMGNP